MLGAQVRMLSQGSSSSGPSPVMGRGTAGPSARARAQRAAMDSHAAVTLIRCSWICSNCGFVRVVVCGCTHGPEIERFPTCSKRASMKSMKKVPGDCILVGLCYSTSFQLCGCDHQHSTARRISLTVCLASEKQPRKGLQLLASGKQRQWRNQSTLTRLKRRERSMRKHRSLQRLTLQRHARIEEIRWQKLPRGTVSLCSLRVTVVCRSREL
jgi:hypothetical protein